MNAPSDIRATGPAPAPGLRQHELLVSGIVAGVLGGIAMLVVAAIAAALQDVDPLRPLEIIGETFVGPDALGHGAKLLLGAVIHLLVSAALGILFAALVPREYGTAPAGGLGVGFGVFAAGLMMTAVVPWANPGFRDQIQVIGGSWVIAHAAFGLVLSIAPALRRRLSGRAGGTAPSVRAPGAAPAPGGARSS